MFCYIKTKSYIIIHFHHRSQYSIRLTPFPLSLTCVYNMFCAGYVLLHCYRVSQCVIHFHHMVSCILSPFPLCVFITGALRVLCRICAVAVQLAVVLARNRLLWQKPIMETVLSLLILTPPSLTNLNHPSLSICRSVVKPTHPTLPHSVSSMKWHIYRTSLHEKPIIETVLSLFSPRPPLPTTPISLSKEPL